MPSRAARPLPVPAVAAALLATGCAGAAAAPALLFNGTAPVQETVTCAKELLTKRGYTLLRFDPKNGLVIGERTIKDTPVNPDPSVFKFNDRVEISTGKGNQPPFRLVTSLVKEKRTIQGEVKDLSQPRAEAVADGDAVVAACGEKVGA